MRDVVAGYLPDGTPILDAFEKHAEARALQLQGEVRAYVDSIVSAEAREMLMADLLKVARGRPVDPMRVAMANAVEVFTDRARAEADAVVARCLACASVDALAAVTVDLAAIGVP